MDRQMDRGPGRSKAALSAGSGEWSGCPKLESWGWGSGKTELIGVVGVGGFDAGAGDEAAESFFAAGAALGADDKAVAIDDHVDGINVGLIHGGEIGVFHHDELAVAGMLFEIFFDGFLGFADVDGEEDEAFVGELVADFVDEGSFVGAEAAPGGPEFEEDDFSFDGVVGELFAGGGGGVEARGGLFVLGSGKRAESRKNQGAAKRYAHWEGARHGEM
jgi:hypothetical protein